MHSDERIRGVAHPRISRKLPIRGQLIAVFLVATALLIVVTWLRQMGLAGIDRQIAQTGQDIAAYNAALLECQSVLLEDTAPSPLSAAERERRLREALARIAPRLRDPDLESKVEAYLAGPTPANGRAIAGRIRELGLSEAEQIMADLTVQSRETVLLSQGTVLLSAFAFLTAVSVLLGLGATLVRRVRALSEAAERVGRGETQGGLPICVPAPERGGDELDELTRQFNAMARQLHEDRQQLTRAWRNAEGANRAKTRMLHWVSHELRTPLTSVVAMSCWLYDGEEGPLTPEQRVCCGQIVTAAEQLQAMIDELLDLARLESGRIEIDLEAVELDEVFQGVRDICQALAAGDVQLGVRVDDELPPVLADPTRLRQVMINLVGNALKFTREGSVTVVARADLGEPEQVLISVIDTGPGIAAEHRAQLFQEFHQVPGTVGGTGLGLAIAQKLVELMGSTIEVESEVGRGTEFRFRLPLATGERVAAILRPGAGEGGEGRRLLVVDDERPVADTMARILKPLGWEVHACLGAGEAVHRAAMLGPDVVTLDILLDDPSGRSGWDVLAALREEAATRDIPVVIVSVVGETAGRREGVAGYLQKPFTADGLRRVLDEVVG